MRPNISDSFRVAVEDGQVVLDFGRSRPAVPGQQASVTLSDRVSISPMTAARLLHGLREALERRAPPSAERVGSVDAELTADSFAGPSTLGATPVNLPLDPAAEKSALLLERIRALGVPYQYERSFRVAPGRLQANRFLVSLNRHDLGGDALERALDVGRQLGMPAQAQDAARAHFDSAQCLHFGFEDGDGAMLCKLYLERKVPPDEVASAAASGKGTLLHLAFKWNVASGTHVVTRYDWFPGLSAEGMEARLRRLYGDGANDASLRIACDTLAIAAPRAGSGGLQYLEVREPDNGRRSFDLNLYDAGLEVRDIQPALLRMRDLYGIRPGKFQALYDQVKTRALGHLAGGLHRDGRDFFNVYYGVTGFPHFAGRFGAM